MIKHLIVEAESDKLFIQTFLRHENLPMASEETIGQFRIYSGCGAIAASRTTNVFSDIAGSGSSA